MTTLYHFAANGAAKGILQYDEAVHEENLDGTDKLTVKTRSVPAKYDRLLWQDQTGRWREHIVDIIETTHMVTTLTCSNSISELFRIKTTHPADNVAVTDSEMAAKTVREHLDNILTGNSSTGDPSAAWEVGTCSGFGKVKLETWHKSMRECIAELCDLVDGELVTDIEVRNNAITARRIVRIVRERGGTAAVLRQFEYGSNMTGVKRTVEADDVYTQVIGYGAVTKEGTHDFMHRIKVVVSAKGGLSSWGARRGIGEYYGTGVTMGHSQLVYTDDDCTDAAFLKTQCNRMLEAYSKPQITYEFEAEQMDGDSWADVSLGRRVLCLDRELGISTVQRVSGIRRVLGRRSSCTITIGKRANPIVEKFKAQEKTTKKATGNSTKVVADKGHVTTGGGYSSGSGRSDSYWGGSGGSSGGSGIRHTLDGVEITGTVAFTTVGGSGSSDSPSDWGSNVNPAAPIPSANDWGTGL